MRQTAVFAAMAAAAMIRLATSKEPPWPIELQPAGWVVGPQPAAIPTSGTWKMEYDNKLDGALHATRSQLLVLESANGQVVGRYKDRQPDGSENKSMLSGLVIPGSPAVVTLRQDDPAGHVAVYVGHVVSVGRIAGSYADNHGRSGDWSLAWVRECSLEPSGSVPDEVLFESVLGVYGQAIRGSRHPFINLRPPQRNLWTDEIQEAVQGSLSYGEVDYIGTAKLVILESGTYTLDIPGAGVEFRINGQRVEAGDAELMKGLYEVEIYTNHWGQPYLTYAEVTVYKKGTKVQIPFVNTASDIEAFRSQKIAGRPVVEACKYVPSRIELEQR